MTYYKQGGSVFATDISVWFEAEGKRPPIFDGMVLDDTHVGITQQEYEDAIAADMANHPPEPAKPDMLETLAQENAGLKEEITAMQLALVEVYEMMIAGH